MENSIVVSAREKKKCIAKRAKARILKLMAHTFSRYFVKLRKHNIDLVLNLLANFIANNQETDRPIRV